MSECQPNDYLSCVCSRGTKGCPVIHVNDQIRRNLWYRPDTNEVFMVTTTDAIRFAEVLPGDVVPEDADKAVRDYWQVRERLARLEAAARAVVDDYDACGESLNDAYGTLPEPNPKYETLREALEGDDAKR